MSFGGTDQSGSDPKANGVTSVIAHTTRWHTGEFFMIQEEQAHIDGNPFATLSVMGVWEQLS